MGKLDSTGTLAQTRGRQGGLVVSSNATGGYARAWFMPRNPRTPAQQAWQRNWSEWARAWRALTSVQRAAWGAEALSPTWSRADWFGQPYQPSGLNLWMMVAAMRAATGQALSVTPPSGTPPGVAISAVMDLQGVDPVHLGRVCLITVTQGAPGAWTYVQVETAWLTSAKGAARNKPYRPLLSQAIGSIEYIDATAAANALVGWIYPETRCWYRWRGLTAGYLPSPWVGDYASP